MLLTWCTTDQRGRHDGFKLATLLNDTQPHAQWGWIKTVYLPTHNAIVSVFLWRQMMVEKKGSVQTAKVLANRRTPLPPSPSPSRLHLILVRWVISISFRCTVGSSGRFRVWSSSLRRLCRRPPADCPAGSSGPGSRSPTGRESAGSSPPAPQRHTGRRLWSSHWPLHKGSPDGRFMRWEERIKICMKTAK